MYTHLTAVENQLQEVRESQQADISKSRLNVLRMENSERELKRVHEVARKAEEACAEKVADLGRLQALLQAMETDNGEQVIMHAYILNWTDTFIKLKEFQCCILITFNKLLCLYPQGEHYSQLLDNEHRMVVSLRSSLQAKEHELTETMDKLLQEKVESAKIQGELTAVRAKLNTANQNITSLQSKVHFLHYRMPPNLEA